MRNCISKSSLGLINPKSQQLPFGEDFLPQQIPVVVVITSSLLELVALVVDARAGGRIGRASKLFVIQFPAVRRQ